MVAILRGRKASVDDHTTSGQRVETRAQEPLYSIRNIERIFDVSVASGGQAQKSVISEAEKSGATGCSSHGKGTDSDQEVVGLRINELDVPASEMVAILGSSGSGKSTLLNLLGNLLECSPLPEHMRAGAVCNAGAQQDVQVSSPRLRLSITRPIGERNCFRMVTLRQDLLATGMFSRVWSFLREYLPWSAASLVRREVGYVFQDAFLLKNATVSANLALPLCLVGTGRWFVDGDRVESVASHLDLGTEDERVKPIHSKLSHRTWPLSGGQAQRVAVGRAVVREPSVILADEPTASLDPIRGWHIIAILKKWQLGRGTNERRSIVWATHNMEHAARFADKVIILRGGSLPLLPDNKEFRQRYGSKWPLNNPNDHRVLEQWLEGKFELVADEATVADHAAKAQQLIDNAPELLQPKDEILNKTDTNELASTDVQEQDIRSENGNLGAKDGSKRIGVLWRIAISEVFSNKNVDGAAFSPTLCRYASVSTTRHCDSRPLVKQNWSVSLLKAALLFVGVAFVAYGLLWEFGSGDTIERIKHTISGGVLGVKEALRSKLAPLCPMCLEHLQALPPIAPGIVFLIGAFIIADVILRPARRAIGNIWEFRTYFLVLVFLMGIIKGQAVIEEIFAAKFKSIDLGHTVIEAGRLKAKLDDQKLADLDGALRDLGFVPSVNATAAQKKKRAVHAPPPEMMPRFVFGRHHSVNVKIARLPSNWDAASAEPKKDCATMAHRGSAGELLAVDMSEPMVQSLTYLEGHNIASLMKTPYKPVRLRNVDNEWGIYLTRKMLLRLGISPEEGAGAIDKHFCLDLHGKKIVWLAGIVERFPSDSSSDYQMLVSNQFFKTAFRDKKKRKLTTYHKASLYLDVEHPADFIRSVECASTAIREIGGSNCDGGMQEYFQEKIGFTFLVEGGFDKVRDAISLGKLFKDMSAMILISFLFLVVLLTLKNSASYILTNERSLCVMRAFGASVWQVLYMVLLQFVVILIPAVAVCVALAYFVWPPLSEPLAETLKIEPAALDFTLRDSMKIGFVMIGALLLGCLLAVLNWWSNSRWIADRLKQV